MDSVAGRVGPQVGVGVFRRRLHFVDPDARTLKFGGMEYHFARCNSVTVLDTGSNHPAWLWCPNCVRPGEAVA